MDEQKVSFDVAVGFEFPKKVIPIINEAKQTIKIIVFDWRWYPNNVGSSCQLFNHAIISAALRNVTVYAMTNIHDVIRILRLNKVSAKKPLSKKLLHSKLMIVDDKVVIIGSHNYTQSAFTMNQEISVILRGKDNLGRFISYFDSVWRS